MNGLVVMDCVQTAYQGRYNGYGASGRMITIRGRRSSDVNRRSGTGHHTSFNKNISRHVKAGRAAAVSMNTAVEPENSVQKKPVPDKSLSKRSVSKSVTASKHAKAGRPAEAASRENAVLIRGRKAACMKKFFFRTLILAFILTGTLAGFQMMTGASSRPGQQAWKYHTTVTIPYGGGLEDIVDQYCSSTYYKSREDYVREVCSINSLPYHRGEIPVLPSGTSLVIPYYSTEYK